MRRFRVGTGCDEAAFVWHAHDSIWHDHATVGRAVFLACERFIMATLP
jgi:hypothetical protein